MTSYVEIRADALRHNLSVLSAMVPHAQVVAVVKANAYGHGLAEVVSVVEPLVHAFQIDDIEELRRLRQITDRPAWVLGYVAPTDIPEALALGGEVVVVEPWQVEAISAAGGGRVHVEVDARFGRLGVLPEGVAALLEAFRRHPKVVPATVYGHYACLDDPTAEASGHEQRAAYESVARAFPDAGRHISATSGVFAAENRTVDFVRLGLGLYGMYPHPDQREPELRPVMRWISHLAQVKTLPAGYPIGYGWTHRTDRPTRVGIVPQGYSDGYDRLLSGCGEVLVRGHRCPVLGRVSMNMMTVAVPDDAQAGDEVTLLGDGITAEEIAERTQTINYVATTRITPLLPRRLA